jgi:hypothetical protein
MQCGRPVVTLLKPLDSDAPPCLADWKNEPVYTTSYGVSQCDMLDSLRRVLCTCNMTYKSTVRRARHGMDEFAKGIITGMGKVMYAKLFKGS